MGSGRFYVSSGRIHYVGEAMNIHFKSQNSDWSTPNDLFQDLNKEFNFSIDVCATKENAKCSSFYSPEDDGLKQKWNGICWMNPPYGKHIRKWMKKAYESSLDGATIVCLVPARTDTKWWHEFSMLGDIRFLRGRIKFENAKHNAPFPSAIVVFKGKQK